MTHSNNHLFTLAGVQAMREREKSLFKAPAICIAHGTCKRPRTVFFVFTGYSMVQGLGMVQAAATVKARKNTGG